MNRASTVAAFTCFCVLLFPACLHAQQQANENQASQREVKESHLRLDLVLSEYNGSQKISSMPYTMYIKAGKNLSFAGSLRMGVKVPVATGSFGDKSIVNSQFTYMDVGTDIDCRAAQMLNGSYDLILIVDRSSVYSPGEEQAEALHSAGVHPVIRKFNANFELAMHDGQTVEGPSATDPFNGHVLKISVTLHVLK